MTEPGPHLLGRIPSPPDDRDFKLENFLQFERATVTDDAAKQADALILTAIDELKKTTITYRNWASRTYADVKVTHWWKALNALQQAHAILGGSPPPPTPSGAKVWDNPDQPLDQGDFGTCVGNGDAQWGNTSPINDHFTQKDARQFYYEATVLDGDPDDPDAPNGGQQGATVRSGVKVLQNHGRLSQYASAASTDEVTAWIKKYGPVIVGTDWYSGMFYPTADGYVAPTGTVEGGHCWVIVGFLPAGATDPETGKVVAADTYVALNSWGTSWGLGGYFRIKVSDFAKLLAGDGEAWTAAELALAA